MDEREQQAIPECQATQFHVGCAETDLGRSYIFYEQLSSDAAHPSLDALNRHIIPHTAEETGGIDVDPVPRDEEIIETLEYLCMAVMGVLIGVLQIIGRRAAGGNALIV